MKNARRQGIQRITEFRDKKNLKKNSFLEKRLYLFYGVDLGRYFIKGEDRLLGGNKAGYNIRAGYLIRAGGYF